MLQFMITNRELVVSAVHTAERVQSCLVHWTVTNHKISYG